MKTIIAKILLIGCVLLVLLSTSIGTWALFYDQETSNDNKITAWNSFTWRQTDEEDFSFGDPQNVEIRTNDIILQSTETAYLPSGESGNWTTPANAYSSNDQYATFAAVSTPVTKSPAANSGSAWTNPDKAYDEGGTGYANVTSGTPSGSNTWGNYGFSLAGNQINQVRVGYDAWSEGVSAVNSYNPAATTNGTNPWTNPTYAYSDNTQYATAPPVTPTYRGTGAITYNTTPITPPLPGGMSANDIVILVASTIADGSITITSDGSVTPWNLIASQNVTSGEMLYVWWGRWSSGSTGPTLTPGGDHCIARTIAYYNCDAENPIDVVKAGFEGAPADTTLIFNTSPLASNYDNERAIVVFSTGRDGNATNNFSNQANGSLSGIQKRFDNTRDVGNGGGFGLIEGLRGTADSIGTWSCTYSAAASSTKAYISFTLRGPDFKQSYGSFNISGTAEIASVEVGYIAWATATHNMNFYTSANGGAAWSSAHNTGNLPTSDPGTGGYTYIDVTTDQTWTWTLLNNTNFRLKMVTNLGTGSPTFTVDALVIRVTTTELDDQIRVDVSWDGGTSWSSTQNTTLTSSETTTWYDVTSATTWDATKLDNDHLRVRALAYSQGTAEVVRLDWLPVEVIYGSSGSTFSHIYSLYGIDVTGYLVSKVEVGIEAYAASSEQIQLQVSDDGGSTWSSTQTSAPLAGSDPNTTTWFDFTSAASWDNTKLNNTYFQVRIWYVGTGGMVNLDYLPVRVTVIAASGTFSSLVLDTLAPGSTWDGLFWDTNLPFGTGITFEVRASDTEFYTTDLSPAWTALAPDLQGTIDVSAGTGKYKQWRATLTTSSGTATPVLEEVRAFYYKFN